MEKNCQLCTKPFKADGPKKYCSRSCAAKVNNTGRILKMPRRFSKIALENIAASNASRTKVYNHVCISCDAGFVSRSEKSKFCSRGCIPRRPSKAVLEGRPYAGQTGGARARSGRSKFGYYENIWCQSTYEMAFVWYTLQQGRTITRVTEQFPYTDVNGKTRQYIPDFIVDGDHYIEIKGWITSTTFRKLDQFPHPITMIAGDEINEIIAAAKNHFGVSDLASIYAENAYVGRTATCKCCRTDFEVKRRTKGIYCSSYCARKKVGTP